MHSQSLSKSVPLDPRDPNGLRVLISAEGEDWCVSLVGKGAGLYSGLGFRYMYDRKQHRAQDIVNNVRILVKLHDEETAKVQAELDEVV